MPTAKSDDAYEDDDFNLNNDKKKPPNKNHKRGFGEKSDKHEESAKLRRERDKEDGEKIASQILSRITKPSAFNRIEGFFLWNTLGLARYRVNVLVNDYEQESIRGATKIAQSYFVVADGNEILKMEQR